MRQFDKLERLPRDIFFERALLNLPDDVLLSALKLHRNKGRNDYPVSMLWSGVLAYFAYKCSSFSELKLQRESSLFLQNKLPVFPPPSSFSRFFHLLDQCSFSLEGLHRFLLEKVFSNVKEKMSLAIGFFDGIHLLWDVFSGLPLLHETGYSNEPHEKGGLRLLAKLKSQAPFLLARSQYLIGESSYEDLTEIAWDVYQLKPIIPLKDRAPSKSFFRDAGYDEKGKVYCDLSKNPTPTPMVFAGFEKGRKSLKYRCMARHYGISCGKETGCPLLSGRRIPLKLDRKIFTPLPRSCFRWDSLFKEYETKEILQNALFPFSKRKKELRISLYSLLLLAASLADLKPGE